MEIYCAVFSTFVPVPNFSKSFSFPPRPLQKHPKTRAGLLSRMNQLGKLSQRTLPKYSAKTGLKKKKKSKRLSMLAGLKRGRYVQLPPGASPPACLVGIFPLSVSKTTYLRLSHSNPASPQSFPSSKWRLHPSSSADTGHRPSPSLRPQLARGYTLLFPTTSTPTLL